MGEALFVGVDGGGTNTTAVVGHVGGVMLGRGRAGASNPSALGFDVAVAAIEAAVHGALADAGLAGEAFQAIALGVAGAGRPADRARLEELLRARPGFPAAVHVVQDVTLLLPTAGVASGVAIVAGTGSSAFGVGPDGRTATAGGWGYLLGDEGSAFAVGRAALRAVGQEADGYGRETVLTVALSTHLRLARPRDLITAVYQSAAPRTTIADLAPLVVAAASDGDAVARAILGENGAELATIAVAVARQLGLAPGAPVVAVGGMLAAGPWLLEPLAAGLAAGGLAPLHALEDPPALGALRLATGELPIPTML
jgi:N-acetylglucosamine kinase-like BadF-type ATPase